MGSDMLEKPGIVATAKALNCLPERKSGSKFVGGCCPKNHGSQGNRCFWIYPGTESFYCQSCKHGGDSFDLVMYAKDCSFPEAKAWLTGKGLISSNGNGSADAPKTLLLYRIITDACLFFHNSLPDQYRDLYRNHYGFHDELIDEHHLGFAPTSEMALVDHLKAKYRLEDIKKTGLLNKRGKSHFQGQLIFPYWNDGHAKYVIGRQTSESPDWKGKYDKLPVYDEQDRPFISQDIKNSVFYGENSIKGCDVIYVAEGVTDCLTGLQHGLPCISPVTTSFAEKDWSKLISLTKGKTVYLIPDNEENEAGMKGAEKTRAHLEEKGIECGIITLPRPDGAVKIDLNEYVRDNGIEAFLGLVQSQRVPCIEDAILTDYQLVALTIPEKRSYLRPWLNECSINSVTGWRGTGKSLFAWGAVNAITKGQNFGPWECGESVNCLILDGEMAVQDGQKRIDDFGTAGRKAELLFYSDHYAHSLGLGRANLLDEKWRCGMAEYMVKRNVKVWVCDNIASLAPGVDENSKSDWDPINQWLLKLRFSGITTVLIHHEGKQGTQRGTSAREDNLDVCLSLKRPPDYTPDQGARFIVNFTKTRIPLEYLPLIADREFQFIRTAGDTYEWTWTSPGSQKKLEILRLSDEGMGVSEIADTVGVAKSYVSKIRKNAMDDGILSKGGKLTQSGYGKMYGSDREQTW